MGARRAVRARRSTPGGLAHGRPLLQWLPPITVGGVRLEGRAQPVLERDLRLPAELVLQLRGIEQVAAVVPGPVREDRLQRLRFAG